MVPHFGNVPTSTFTPYAYESIDYFFDDLYRLAHFTTIVKPITYEGKKCYSIEYPTKTILHGENNRSKEIIDKETGLILYDYNYSAETRYKEKVYSGSSERTTKYEYRFDTVTDEDVAKPDLTGYTLKEINDN